MNDCKIKAIVLEPGKVARVTEIESRWSAMEEVVQGDLEAIYPFDDPVCIVCNGNGKNARLPLCRVLFGSEHKIRDIICGPAFICGFNEDGLTSLDDSLIDKYLARFLHPECLLSWEMERRRFHNS